MRLKFALTQDVKDQLKEDAYEAYVRCYGKPKGGSIEQYYVSKGIEAMAGIVFERLEYEDN